jgi:2-keto-4-pentenoate hydratase
MLTEEERVRIAGRLRAAERDRAPIPPLTETHPGIDAVDAYEIQLLNIGRRLAAGGVVHGHKVGLSSKAMQQMMGVDEPDYGHLLADMALRPDEPVVIDRYCHPRVEVETGFVLGADLPGEDCTEADVLTATERVVPAIELIDSRIADWRIKLADTVADLASNGAVAVSSRLVPLDGLDTRLVGMTLTRNGELVDTGAGAAALGDPLAVVAWLANVLGENGVALEPGHLVMTGALHAAVPMNAGDVFRAEFDRLGPVTVRVISGSSDA